MIFTDMRDAYLFKLQDVGSVENSRMKSKNKQTNKQTKASLQENQGDPQGDHLTVQCRLTRVSGNVRKYARMEFNVRGDVVCNVLAGEQSSTSNVLLLIRLPDAFLSFVPAL